MTDRVELLLRDIADGPAALARLGDAYADLASPLSRVGARPARIVFSGLGSSRYAALAVEPSFRAGEIATTVEFASTSSPTEPAADLVFVAISASGGTREVVEAARRHRGTSRVIAITNREDSALAQSADVVLPLFAGEERSGVATRSFRATLALLGLLADCWLTEPAFGTVSACVDALSLVLGSKDRWLAEACDRLDGARAVDVLADATDLGLAEQAALMLREGPRLPAVVYETSDWLHTGVYLAFPGHRALLFTGSAADREVIRTIHGRSGDTVVVGPRIDGATPSIAIETAGTGVERAIVESVVAELLAAGLWGRTEAMDKGA